MSGFQSQLWLVAAMTERTAKVVWIGRDGTWQYDKPHGLPAFQTKEAADHERWAHDLTMNTIFGQVVALSPPQAHVPHTLRNLRVIEFVRRKK